MSAPEGDLPGPAQRPCPRCGGAVDPLQEFCLDCGLRLPLRRTTSDGGPAQPDQRAPWSGGWIAPALFGLLVAVFGTAAAIAFSDDGESPATVRVATGGSRTAPETTSTLTAPEPPARPSTTAQTRTNVPPPTAAPRTPTTLAWPRERRGWTIVLVSLPQSGGRRLAETRAAEARRGGIPDVGVLNSSRFASLHPGYFVVFAGIFDSEAEATSGLSRARSAFPLAYRREIVP